MPSINMCSSLLALLFYFIVQVAAALSVPAPMHALCEDVSIATPAAYELSAEDAHRRTVYVRGCSFAAGLALTSSPPGAPVANAAVFIIDAKVAGALTLNVVLGAGSSLDVIGMAPLATSGSPPDVALLGSLLLGAQMSFHASSSGRYRRRRRCCGARGYSCLRRRWRS